MIWLILIYVIVGTVLLGITNAGEAGRVDVIRFLLMVALWPLFAIYVLTAATAETISERQARKRHQRRRAAMQPRRNSYWKA